MNNPDSVDNLTPVNLSAKSTTSRERDDRIPNPRTSTGSDSARIPERWKKEITQFFSVVVEGSAIIGVLALRLSGKETTWKSHMQFLIGIFNLCSHQTSYCFNILYVSWFSYQYGVSYVPLWFPMFIRLLLLHVCSFFGADSVGLGLGLSLITAFYLVSSPQTHKAVLLTYSFMLFSNSLISPAKFLSFPCLHLSQSLLSSLLLFFDFPHPKALVLP